MQRCAARPCSRTRPRKASAAKTRGRRVGALRVNERATILRARARRAGRRQKTGPPEPGSPEASAVPPSEGRAGREHLLPAEGDLSYPPGLEGSGWGKFGKNPLLLSRAAALRDEPAPPPPGQNPKPPPLGQRRVARRRARAREKMAATRTPSSRGSFRYTRGEQGFTPERFRDERGGRGVPRGRLGRGRADAAEGAPRPDDAFDGTEAVSARNRVFSGFSPPATSEGSDIYTSSLDRTTAHILAHIKRDIFAPRRRSLDARAKAAAGERRRWRARHRRRREFVPRGRVAHAERPQSERRQPARASLGSVFGARGRDTGGDTFVDTNGGGSPGRHARRGPRGGTAPRGPGPGSAARRGSLGAALFKASGGGSGSSANPEETFPPRRSRRHLRGEAQGGGVDARAVVAWRTRRRYGFDFFLVNPEGDIKNGEDDSDSRQHARRRSNLGKPVWKLALFFFTKRTRRSRTRDGPRRVVRIERLAFFRERRGVSRVAFRRLSWSGDAREGRREGRRPLFWPSGSFFAGARRASEKRNPPVDRWVRAFFGGFLATNAFLAKSLESHSERRPRALSRGQSVARG